MEKQTNTYAQNEESKKYYRFQVFGTNGWIEVRDATHFTFQPAEGAAETIVYPEIDAERAEIEGFADAIEGRTPFPVPAADAVKLLAQFEPGEVRTFIDTSDGSMRTGKGEVDGADVTLHTDWETSRKIIVEQDQQAAMQAFMSGKIKVTGDMTKIMMMNAAPPTDAQKAAAEDIKNLTA